jgi:FkbM family methyltransferase
MRFACFPNLPDSSEVFVKREIDHPEDKILSEWLEPGDLVVDAGANVGLYTWRAHHFLDGNGTFVAIDASERICEYLREAVLWTGLGNIHVCNYALGNADKEVEFYEAPLGGFTSEQSLKVDAARSQMTARKTQMTTLGNVPAIQTEKNMPALVKIDIEGAEVMALSGAPEIWLGGAGPLWIVEINPAALDRFSASPQQVLDFFQSDRFQKVLIPKFPKTGGSSGKPRVYQPAEKFSDALFYNLVAIPLGAERKLSLLGVSQIGAES